MSFPPGTEMFQFPGFASVTYGFSAGYRISGGFPHSEICGSKGARPSPQLIAACHVLHRLSVPRHPPDALKRLISASSTREAPRTVASALNPEHSAPYIDASPRSRNNPPSPTDPSRSPFQPKTGDRSVFAFSSQCPISAVAFATCHSSIRSCDPSSSLVPAFAVSPSSSHTIWWRRTGSNRRPHACKARALPTELRPQGWWAREDLNLRPHAYQARALTS
jgi:hypothetical protein